MEFVWCFENSNALHISMAVWRLKFVFCNNFSHCIAHYSTDDFISKLSSHTALRIHMCLLWCAAQLHTDWCLQLLPERAWRICVVEMWYSNLDYNSPQIFRIGCWAFALWSIMKMCCEFECFFSREMKQHGDSLLLCFFIDPVASMYSWNRWEIANKRTPFSMRSKL